MKKLIILLLFIIHISSWSQVRIIKTTTPCNDEILYKTHGKWFKGADVWQVDHIKFNATQQQEVRNRVDKIHQMMLKIYPEPIGVDVTWHRTLGYGTFADQVTYIRTDPFTLDRVTVVERPVASFGYVAGFFRHFCKTKDPHEISPGYPGETKTWWNLFTNAFDGFAVEYFGNEDTLTIGGYPVHLRQPLKQKYDGYELYFSKAKVDNPDVTSEMYALIHRKGQLPHIPVTRKQYLEKCISHLATSLEKFIKNYEQMPLVSADEQATRKEQVAELKKNNEAVLKRYRDELEETTRHGLPDAPAIIPVTIFNMDEYAPIFVEESKGWMIMRTNPNYMRKDLPKYVPQFFVVQWSWNDWKPEADVGKLIEEKFPFDKLHAMIDK
jgi:ElaB/YqjD/DUF883 family membrane-anchored ribosome-binding protein